MAEIKKDMKVEEKDLVKQERTSLDDLMKYKVKISEIEKLTFENHRLEKEVSKYNEKTLTSITSQTDAHPDIPYLITSPLPPIFSSNFCHKSNLITKILRDKQKRLLEKCMIEK